MLSQQVFAAPASKVFVENVAEIAISWFEIKFMNSYGCDPDPAAPALVDKFRYRPGNVYNELTVFSDDIFRWNQNGELLSAPLKSEEEWLEWIGKL